jgi:hypothetical protein
MAIFPLSICGISRAKGHSVVAQIAYDTHCQLSNERTGEKLEWSKLQSNESLRSITSGKVNCLWDSCELYE